MVKHLKHHNQMVNPGPTGCFVGSKLNHSTDDPPRSTQVHYPGLSSHPQHALCRRPLTRTFGRNWDTKKNRSEKWLFFVWLIRVFMCIPINFLVGGLEHEWMMFPYVSISYMGCHPKPIDELIFFNMVIAPPTSIYIYISILINHF